MSAFPAGGGMPELDGAANEEIRQKALQERCFQYRARLRERDPFELARLAAMGTGRGGSGEPILYGEHWAEPYEITWPALAVTGTRGEPAPLHTEALWLHYLDRADGRPLAGRWVNLSEIGGLFYQQAFQSYTGNKIARAWGENLEGLRRRCVAEGGWKVDGLGDLAYEWRALPRLPVCLCYRGPTGSSAAWATVLFDAAADHYAAADVAAIVGRQLAGRLVRGMDQP